MISAVESTTARALEELRELYDRGRYLQLYQQATQAWGPLQQWPGLAGGVLASRVANQLCAPGLSGWILRRLRREAPDDPEVRYCSMYWLLSQRGPYKTWRRLHENLELGPGASNDIRASWYGLIGQVAAMLRDFETAEAWLRKADAVAPSNPWIHAVWAHFYELEDRYEDALAAAQRCFEIRPMYRAGVQAAGHLLSLLNRDAEAIELYQGAMEVIESVAVALQLYALQMEVRDYSGAERTLADVIRYAPLAEKDMAKWVAAQRSELAYFQGNMSEAIAQAQLADTPYYKAIAENLTRSQPERAGSVLLEVPFVRQHHMTCAPATLSAISRFWSKQADHVQVADEICYNGTTSHAERKWAQENGWSVKEFSVTAESAQQLLDRGIPFTFVTVEPGSAHLQAIIGYDERRRTLQIRDPYWRNSGEPLADKLLERYRPFGPRGMAMAPIEFAEKLEDLELPDAKLWDRLHGLDSALVKHNRQAAQESYNQMREHDPHHRLTFDARRRLAIYDANPTEQLAAVDKMLEQFPQDERLQWERLALMRYQTSREDRLNQFAEVCRKSDSHPIFWRTYAQELQQDARRHDDAEVLLKKSIRRWPTDAANYFTLAGVRWDQRRWDEALELYRFAACLDDKDEQYSRSYFIAATWTRQTETLLRMLRDRFVRYGAKSMQPARTLATALVDLSREREALEVVEEALLRRPDDGQLKLYAADLYLMSSHENRPRALELIEAARSCTSRPEWLRSSARLANASGDPTRALAEWRELAEIQPLAVDVHHAIARLLASLDGRRAALDYLAEVCQRWPNHHALHIMWLEWLREEPIEVREPVLRHVVSIAPDDAWVRRELAGALESKRQFEEAWRHAELAGKLEPYNPSFLQTKAFLYRSEGRIAEAKQALRSAIELSVDSDYAIAELIRLSSTLAERREALAFVRDELVRQVTFGDGLLAFRYQASGVLDADELLAELQAALAARPDLWHAHSAVTMQLLIMNRLDESLENARRATERFPLMPRVWIDLSRVERARLEFDAEQHAIENALRVNPGWSMAVGLMCECLGRKRDFEAARQFAEQAVSHSPLDSANHVILAEQLWQLDEHQAALDRVRHAIQLEPGDEQAWDLLNEWSDKSGQPELAVETARELTVRRPGETRSWLMLARVLEGPDELAERLAALDRAVELNPQCVDAYDKRAFALAKAGRFREAHAACEAGPFGEQQPSELRVRAAWIDAERGDWQTAIERIRPVLAEEPQYYSAWSLLAEWCRILQDGPGYLEASENLARLNPQSETTLGFLGEARLVNGDRDGAKAAYARAFELSPKYEFAGNGLFDLHLKYGDLAAAAEVMDVLREHCPTGLVMARDVQLAVRQQEFERGLQVLERLCIEPCESRWALDTGVRELVEAGQAAEVECVLEAAIPLPDCQSEVGRHWVEVALDRARQGGSDGGQAVAAIEPRLPREKAYFHAWMRLANEYRALEKNDDYLRASEAVAECDNTCEMAYGFLGDAKFVLGDRDGAIDAFERAVQISPAYEYASNYLLAIYFEDSNLPAAERIIKQVDTERPTTELLSRKAQLAALQGNSAEAAARLREVCLRPLDDRWPLSNAVRALEAAGMERAAEDVLAPFVDTPEPQYAVASQWSRLASERDATEVCARLPSLFARPAVCEPVLQAWVEHMGRANRGFEMLRFLRHRQNECRQNVRIWGVFAYGATLVRDYLLTYSICANWRDYPDAEAWMLVNAVEGFRALGFNDEAIAAGHHALTLPGNGIHLHHLWLACDAACAGDFAQSREHAQHIHAEPLDQDYQFLEVLLTGILEVEAAGAASASVFDQVRRKVDESFSAYRKSGCLSKEPARRRIFGKATWRIASLAGTWRARLWSIWCQVKMQMLT